MTRPVILLDQDGPLADFDRAFFAHCEARGYEMDCTLDTQRHRFATDHIIDKEQRAAARRWVDGSRWFRDLPVVKGALEGLEALEEVAKIWIVTKPLIANPTNRDDKAAWVAEHLGARWVDRLIHVSDKSMIRGDILLDDAPHLPWIDRAIWRPVIFRSSWNGPGSRWDRIPSWTWGEPIDELLEHA